MLIFSFSGFAQEFSEFEWLIEDSIRLRMEMLQNENELEQITEDDVIYSGGMVNKINEEAMKRFKHGKAGMDFLGYLKYTVKKRIKKKYKPTKDQLKDTMMFLGLSVTMADSYLFAYSKISKNGKLRRLLDSPDSAIGKDKNLFSKSTREFFKFKNRKFIRRAIKVYKKFYLPKKKEFDQDIEFAKIDDVIQMSYMYEKLSKTRFIDKVADFFGVLGQRIGNSFKIQGDFFNKLGNGVLFGLSKFFGNTVGQLQSRHGKLFMDHEFMKTVKDQMQPLDMLFEKTPFRATDRFIPGYWGHAAIYIGTEAQLKELGIWEHPVVQKFHYDIKLGKTIVEALRPGVQINTFRHFTDVDDFALVRRKFEMTNEEIADHIIRALNQVGKKYDFGFDTEVPNKIVCSELHYTVWKNIKFETSTVIGRETINVDQVVVQATTGMPFEPMMLYLDGKRVYDNIQAVYDMIYNDSEYDASKVRALEMEKPSLVAESTVDESELEIDNDDAPETEEEIAE